MAVSNKRARDDDAKAERREALLAAAGNLFSEAGSLPSVDQIAKATGLAKGTVYLYFRSREALFLALIDAGFTRLFARLDNAIVAHDSLSAGQVGDVIADAVLADVEFLPLAALGTTVVETNIGRDEALAFKRALAEHLVACGELLARRLPNLSGGEAVNWLLASYSLILGLWQSANPPGQVGDWLRQAGLGLLLPDFSASLRQSLRALWRGALGSGV